MNDNEIKFGKSLRILRESYNLTLRNISENTGISLSTLSKIERGAQLPRIDNAIKISQMFHISVEKMAKGDDCIREEIEKSVLYRQCLAQT